MSERVLFLDQTGMLGGAELSLIDIAHHYRATGRVLLFSYGPLVDRLREAGVTVEVLRAENTLSKIRREGSVVSELWTLPRVADLVLKVARAARDVDVLYANSQKAFVVGALAAFLARKPMIWHLRDILTFDHFSDSHRRLVVAIANAMRGRVITNSQATADAFCASGGRPEKVTVVYNGIDPAPFTAVTPEAAAAARGRLGLGSAPIVGVFSRFAHWKGQDVFVEAIAKLPGVHGILVGKPLFGEDEYERSVRAKAEQLGVADRVHFLGFRDDVPSLMAATDIVAMTSVAPEPFGRVIIEAMLLRKPVIATRAGGPLEIIRDGVNGRLVTPGSAAELADAIADLLAHPECAQRMAGAGFCTAVERFSLPAMLEGISAEISRVARKEFAGEAWKRVPSPSDDLRAAPLPADSTTASSG